MKYFIVFIYLFSAILLQAQNQFLDKFEFQIDALRSPSSSAAGLLGVTSSQIQRPEEATDIIAFVETATNGLSEMPSNFALDANPNWILNKHEISFGEYIKHTSLWNNIKQSFSLSFATKNDKDSETLQTAFGVNFSIFRGGVDEIIQRNIEKQLGLFYGFMNEIQAHPEIKQLNEEIEEARRNEDVTRLDSLLIVRLETNEKVTSEILQEAEDSLNFTQFRREGFFLEIAAGQITNFVEGTFSSKESGGTASWLTFGNNFDKNHSLLGIVRYQNQPNIELLDDQLNLMETESNNIEGGIRYLYEKKKWHASGEYLYRQLNVKNSDIENSERWTLNLGYKLGKNSSLNAVFGKDFDETNIREGNVLAGINFFKGLGNTRAIKK